MTNIILYEKDSLMTGFQMEGHSGYAEEGMDIVCSALSALAFTAANSFEEVLGIMPALDIEESYIYVMLPADLSQQDREKADIILRTISIGFESIKKEYPSNVSIKRRRCEKC